MPILAAKTKAAAFGALLTCGILPAQEPPGEAKLPPVSVQAAPPSAPTTVAVPGDSAAAASAAMVNGFYDKKAQDGTAAQKTNLVADHLKDKAIAGEALQLGVLKEDEIKARFEKFLGTSPVPAKQLNDYAATIQRTEDLLRNRQTFDAWKQLYVLAQYPAIDAGVARELANRIEAVWNAGQTTTQIRSRNKQLEAEIKTASRNADMISENVRQKDRENARLMAAYQKSPKTGGGTPPLTAPGVPVEGPQAPPDASALMGKLALTDEYLRSLEGRARIKLNELKAEKLLDQVKKEFSDYVASLYAEGFYPHVILAADFYRRLFQEGDYPVEMAKQVNSALEKSRDVASTVDVFEYKIGRSELAAATNRLAEGFVASAYHPALLSLPRDEKQDIANYLAQLDAMRNLIEARDYAGLEEMARQVKTRARDFDITKPMALVNAAKLEGQLRLGKAKILAQQGKMEESMKEFEAAAQAWPSNPDLRDKAGVFFAAQDVKTQSLAEFDRLASEQNYRIIFEKQVAFAPAIQGDKVREEAFAKALTAIKNAEIAAEKANALLLNGDVVGAWEAVELAAKDLPDDQKLNKLRADLSGRSAEFVNAISRAKDAEQKRNLGFALTWYANAQRQYPPSQMANAGIERVSKEILTPKSPAL